MNRYIKLSTSSIKNKSSYLSHKYTMNERSEYDCPVYNLSYDPWINYDRAIIRGYVFSLSSRSKMTKERERYNYYSFNKRPLKRQARIPISIRGR